MAACGSPLNRVEVDQLGPRLPCSQLSFWSPPQDLVEVLPEGGRSETEVKVKAVLGPQRAQSEVSTQAKVSDHTLKRRTQSNCLVVHKTVIIPTMELKRGHLSLWGQGGYFRTVLAFHMSIKALGSYPASSWLITAFL